MLKSCLKIIVCAVFALLVGSEVAYADNAPYIDHIQISAYPIVVPSWPPTIGNAPEEFSATTYLSDGTVATGDEYKDMVWKIERYDNVSKTYETVATGEGEEMRFWMPYGTEPGQFYVTAYSKVEPDAFGYLWYQLHYSWYTQTFCICQPGAVKKGGIDGTKPLAKDIKETWDPATKKYTCVLPECTYDADYYTFAGWEKDGKVYQPGDKYVSGYGDEPDGHNAYFTAKWKASFDKPSPTARKMSKSSILLQWNRMIGGKGYKVFRSTKKGGKYKLVKTVRNSWTRSWTDKKVKRGVKYYYKVAAFKKGSKKTSPWVAASTKGGSVVGVEVSQDSLAGAAGGSAKLKAKVETSGGKPAVKGVRWFTSNAGVAKVNQKTGKVTFVKPGTCKVWAMACDGSRSGEVRVIVTAKATASAAAAGRGRLTAQAAPRLAA